MDAKFDIERYRASIERLHQIFSGISDTITEVSQWRCPYKNVSDRCTATFRCRNQDGPLQAEQLPRCTGSDDLDYRQAWQDTPAAGAGRSED